MQLNPRLLALPAFALLAACSDDVVGGVTGTGTGTPGAGTAVVRVVNASSTVGSLDVLRAGTAASGGTGLTFGGASSCLGFDPANPAIGFRSGTGTAFPTFVPSPAFVAGGRYTIVLAGAANAPRVLQLAEDAGTPATGRARVRLVNAAGGLGTYDVYVTSGSAGLGTTPSASGIASGGFSSFVDVPAGPTRVRLTNPGTQTVVADFGVTLQSGEVRTVVAGDPSAGGSVPRTFAVTPCG